jgi:DNA polymerase V
VGDPLFKVKPLINKHDIQVYSSNYSLYGDMSARVMTVLKGFTPQVEIYSIDEAFVGFDDFVGNDPGRYRTGGPAAAGESLEDYARYIRRIVRQYTGIPVCLGLAPTKTLAKIANRLAKKDPANEGVLVLDTQEKQQRALEQTAVKDVWGIGRQHAGKLAQAGIHTAWQLANQPVEWARRHLGGVVGMRLVQELRGIACIQLELFPEPKKAIACTRSFGKPVTSLGDLSEAVSTYISMAAEKLRRQHSCTNIVTVFIHTSRFVAEEAHYSASTNVVLPVPSNHTGELIHHAMGGLKRIYREGPVYKKAGVIFNALTPADQVQTALFDQLDREKGKKLMATLDKVNGKLGANTLAFASSGTEKPWKLICEKRSPRYTTQWNELMVVRA